MQSKWDRDFSYVHRPTDALLDGDTRLSFRSIAKMAISRRKNCAFIFHAQASLPYLIVFWLLSTVFRRANRNLVYDIHDLHERENWTFTLKSMKSSLVRYYAFSLLEKIVFTIAKIKKITVSEGLAVTMATRYKAQKPLVVYNVSLANFSSIDVVEKKPSGVLLYFGTTERVPLELIPEIYESGCELHIYGRGITRDWLRERIPENLLSCVRIFGKYHPLDLTFIQSYMTTIIYSPNVETLNFKYSMPNKFFQALQAGASVLASSNFFEMCCSFQNVPGAVGVLSPGKLMDSIEATLGRRAEKYEKLVTQELESLSERSKFAYLTAVGAL